MALLKGGDHSTAELDNVFGVDARPPEAEHRAVTCVSPWWGAFGASMGFRMSLMVLAIHRLVRSALVYRGRA